MSSWVENSASSLISLLWRQSGILILKKCPELFLGLREGLCFSRRNEVHIHSSVILDAVLLLGSVQWEREGRKEQEREGARERETGKEEDVSDWLCLLDSHRFSFVLLRESRQRAISSLSHLDHGQVASSVPLSRTLPPVSDTLPFPASKVRIKVKRLSFKASLVRSLLIPSDSIRRAL